MGNIKTDNSPIRKIDAKVEVYDASTGAKLGEYTNNTNIIKITIERVGEDSKFFGFGICQKLNLHLLDLKRVLNFSTNNYIKVYFNNENKFPKFYISEVHRDEKTNEISITAYDALYKASQHTVDELKIKPPYAVSDFLQKISVLLQCNSFLCVGITPFLLTLKYEDGANFNGKETLRDALDDISELYHSVYSINSMEQIEMLTLGKRNTSLNITKEEYFNLNSSTNRRLSAVCYTNALGDSVEAKNSETGSVQYIKDNAFIETRADIGEIVETILSDMNGLTINQFECEWRGNLSSNIGENINLATKDNKIVSSYILDDVINYDGSFQEKTKWKYQKQEGEENPNSSNLGDAIKETFAKVDKANKKIDIVASETNQNTKNLASLQIQTDSINATVTETTKKTSEEIGKINKDVATLTNTVSQQITPEKIEYLINQKLEDGVNSVETSTGFTFNKDGLTVAKSGKEMTTQITEDGMKVYRGGNAVLTANNTGVDAENLHATTYLIIGKNSRFEDYGSRTGCFWIGG